MFQLSNNETALACLSKLADLRELIATMRRNMENLQFLKSLSLKSESDNNLWCGFVRYAVYLLSNLAVNEELKDSIGVEGGIQVLRAICVFLFLLFFSFFSCFRRCLLFPEYAISSRYFILKIILLVVIVFIIFR